MDRVGRVGLRLNHCMLDGYTYCWGEGGERECFVLFYSFSRRRKKEKEGEGEGRRKNGLYATYLVD